MGEFRRVIAASELAPGQCREALAGDRPIALCNVAGEFHALENRCAHRGGPLGQGVLAGTVLVCPWHAWGFDVTTGISDVNAELRVGRYEVKLEDGQVFVKVE